MVLAILLLWCEWFKLLLFESILLTVQQFIAFEVGHVAHVAGISKREVMVAASLTSPIADSLRASLLGSAWELWGDLLHGFPLLLSLLRGDLHVSWHTIGVFGRLDLLAPVAFLAAFEVVVLALGALPAALRELEVSSLAWSVFLLAVAVGRARAGREVLEVVVLHLLDSSVQLGHSVVLWDGWLWSHELLHVWEELLLWLWGALWGIPIVVINCDVIDSSSWSCPNWVLRKN